VDAAADDHVRAIIANNGGAAARVAQSPGAKPAPTANVQTTPEANRKAVASTRERAL